MRNHRTVRRARRAALALPILALVACFALPVSALADTSFRITGGGWGHGIGMSQYGAQGYAKSGWTYGDILRWYYGGDKDGSTEQVSVRTLESLGKTANPLVRVNIEDGKSARSSWTLRGYKTRLRVSATGSSDYYLSADAYHKFTASGTEVEVAGRTFDSPVTVTPETIAGVSPPLTVVSDDSGPYNYNYVRYRGAMRLTVSGSGLSAVNEVPMESYLYGVIPRESPSSWDMEALKAQSVAARSYAWGRNKPSSATSKVLSGELYCTTYSQVYGGHSRLKSGSVYMHEASRTNDAVQATKGQIMYHAPSSTVITTYFSASTGGRTAAIEDVWTEDDPKPYFKSVKDADTNALSGNPYYTWTPVTKTGAQLATALRDKDNGSSNTDRLDYTAPYPAKVTKVTHDRAASGFVRDATIYWSNGQHWTVDGDIIRSALGLKSTKFTIKALTFGTAFQESDSRIRYSRVWKRYSSSRASGGADKRASRNNAIASIAFKGTGFRWNGTRYTSGGLAEVYLDGVRKGRVNVRSSSSKFRQPLWTVTGLSPDTTHTVHIRVLGQHYGSGSGTNVGIDSVEIEGGSLVPALHPGSYVRYDDRDAGLPRSGTWTAHSNSDFWGGGYITCGASNASMTALFTGTRIRVYTRKGPDGGKAKVYFDTRAPVTIDTYAPVASSRTLLWESGSLPFGTHTVRVVNTGSKNASSTATGMSVDCVDVFAGPLLGR